MSLPSFLFLCISFSHSSIGEFTGSSISPFPYLLAGQDDQQIFSKDCVPEGFALMDPDHLKAETLNSLYSHMLKRQQEGLAPFVILNCSPHHFKAERKSKKAKAKAKAEYWEVSSDEDKAESGEEMEQEDGASTEVVKIGPPKSKRKTIPMPSQDDLNAVAGPSNLNKSKKRKREEEPPKKDSSKKSRGKGTEPAESVMQINLDDLPIESPVSPKRLKSS